MKFFSVAFVAVFLCVATVSAVDLKPSQYLETYKCMTAFLEKSLTASKYSKLLDFYAPLFKEVTPKMEACIREKSGSALKSCIENQAKDGSRLIESLIYNVIEYNYAYGNKLAEEMNDTCDAEKLN